MIEVTNLNADGPGSFRQAVEASGITTHPATEAYDLVLDNAGAIAPMRDAVDKRVIQSVRDNTGSIIDII